MTADSGLARLRRSVGARQYFTAAATNAHTRGEEEEGVDKDDKREKVVILGSGWAGMSPFPLLQHFPSLLSD